MNKAMFKSKMKLFSDTNETLARAIGISRQRLSAKINATNGAEFTQSEVSKIKERYSLTPIEIDSIFFTFEVS